MSSQNAPTRQPLTQFLSLAPTVSESYPQTQDKSRARGNSTASATSDATSPVSDTSSRRSSEASGTSGQAKVLKLGPVHWGEHTDDHKADFYEV